MLILNGRLEACWLVGGKFVCCGVVCEESAYGTGDTKVTGTRAVACTRDLAVCGEDPGRCAP
jgi:hypothetical protein